MYRLRCSEFARTRLTCETVGNAVKLTVGGREGSFVGMPGTRDFIATIHLPARPKSTTLDGAAVTDAVWNDAASTLTVKMPACGDTPRVLVCE